MPKTPQALRVAYSSITYDPPRVLDGEIIGTARYRSANGRFLSAQGIRDAIEDDIEATRDRMVHLVVQVQRGEITVEEWREAYAKQVKYLHLASLAAAKGGFHATTQADFGRVGQILRVQYGYLDKRAQTAASDPAYMKSGNFENHALQYADAGLETYEAQRLVEDQAAGLVYEFNELDDASHHCNPKGDIESCQQQTDKGVVLAGSLIRWGGCACRNRCRCYRNRFKTRSAAEKAYTAIYGRLPK